MYIHIKKIVSVSAEGCFLRVAILCTLASSFWFQRSSVMYRYVKYLVLIGPNILSIDEKYL